MVCTECVIFKFISLMQVLGHVFKGFSCQGYTAGLATYAPFVGIYFVCYEQSKRLFGRLYHTHPEKLPFYTHLFSGFVSGAIAAAATCPLDVIKTRMQVLPVKEGGYSNMVQAFRLIIQNESIR